MKEVIYICKQNLCFPHMLQVICYLYYATKCGHRKKSIYLPAYLEILLRRSCCSWLLELMFALEIYSPALQVQGGREKAASLYHSALCKHLPFHMNAQSTDRQPDATLPCSEEWKGEEPGVFHMKAHIHLCLSCAK